MANIIEQSILAENPKSNGGGTVYVYVPQATNNSKGIAKYNSRDFQVDDEGQVSLETDVETILKNVPMSYGTLLPPYSTNASGNPFPEIDTTAKTITFKTDTILLDQRLNPGYDRDWVMFRQNASGVGYASNIWDLSTVLENSWNIGIWYNISLNIVMVRDFNDEIDVTDNILLVTYSKMTKAAFASCPVMVDGKIHYSENTNIVQETGTSTDKVMSQKAVTSNIPMAYGAICPPVSFIWKENTRHPFPEIDSVAKTLTFPGDTRLIDNRLPYKVLLFRANSSSAKFTHNVCDFTEASELYSCVAIWYNISSMKMVATDFENSNGVDMSDNILLVTYSTDTKSAFAACPVMVDGIIHYAANTNIEQTVGNNTNKVISQKVTSDLLLERMPRMNIFSGTNLISVDIEASTLTIPTGTRLIVVGKLNKLLDNNIVIGLKALTSGLDNTILYNKSTDTFEVYSNYQLPSLDLNNYYYFCSVIRGGVNAPYISSTDIPIPHRMNGELVKTSPVLPRPGILTGKDYISVDDNKGIVIIPEGTVFFLKGFRKVLNETVTLSLYPISSTSGSVVVYNARTDEISVLQDWNAASLAPTGFEGIFWLFSVRRKASYPASVDITVPYYLNGKLYGISSSEFGGVDNFNEYGLPVLYLIGDTSAMTKDNAVTLSYEYEGRTGTCTVKWQGSSSLAYPKKNYTVKFDTAFEAVEGWGEEKKYCFKANWIDASHARNIVNAKLWGEIVKSRTDTINNIENLPNGGAVDGFPCIICINDKFAGLYTFNIPKDGWMYGMGSGTKEAILCADAHTDATNMRALATLDGDFELEYVTDEDNSSWVKESLNNLINACINSNGKDLDTTIASMLDWDSAIDYYIFTCLIGGGDMTDKNYILSTYDGTKWFFGAYDMDCTYGLTWEGQDIKSVKNSYPTFAYYSATHRVMYLIRTYKKDALKARYTELRNSVMSEDNLATLFANFIGDIPSEIYSMERKKWTTLPSTSVSNLSQITDWYRRRVIMLDAEINNM